MVDKTAQLMLDALSRAIADPGGLPLHGNKKSPGLFTSNTAGKQVAQRCKEEGYLRILPPECNGKSVHETCAITEKGIAYLLSQTSPRRVLEDLVQTLRAHQSHVCELVLTTQRWQTGIDALQATVERVLQQLTAPPGSNGTPAGNPGPTPSKNGFDLLLAEMTGCLVQWQSARASEDCPLPELFRRAHAALPGLTIGHFHDGLRQLHDRQQVYLHPWSGPLYEIPEPLYALMIGHEIAYYASIRM